MDIFSIFLAILILLVLARFVGEIMERFGQSAMIGEILVGILLGPSILSVIHPEMSGLDLIAYFGIFFLMFFVGLEMRLEDIRKVGRNALLIAWGGMLIPFLLGFLVGIQFTKDVLVALFLGVCLSITAIAVSAKILMEMGKLNTRIGRTIMAAAIINDIIAIVILTLIVGVAEKGSIHVWDISLLIIKIMLFIGFIFLIDKILKMRHRILSQYITHYLRKFRTKEAEFAMSLIVALGFAMLAEAVGLHFIIGAFFAGLLIHDEIIGSKAFDNVYDTTSGVTLGFLAPIFFAFVGLQFNLHKLVGVEQVYLILAILVAAISGKLIGTFIGGKLSNMRTRKCLIIGVAMNGRGVIEIVIAAIGLEFAIIGLDIFSAIVLMALITTIMTPILLRWIFRHYKRKKRKE